jgi:Putative zinc-finger
MFDCANVEMRELLPELVAGTLDATTRARVEEHVAACPECASELETLRLVRATFARAPKIDASHVVASLPRPRAVVAAPQRNAKVIRWLDWRIAAALTTITVGGLSVAVSQRMRDVTAVLPSDSASAQVQSPLATHPNAAGGGLALPNKPVPSDRQTSSTGTRSSAPEPVSAAVTSPAKPQLSVGGGMGDLDDASLQSLLGALEEIDHAPVAPSAEPDRSPVLPIIKAGNR